MPQIDYQIKLISPIQKRSVIENANRRLAQFRSVFSLIFRYAKSGREKAHEKQPPNATTECKPSNTAITSFIGISKSVKELLGHASVTMTMRYSHLAPDHRMRAI